MSRLEKQLKTKQTLRQASALVNMRVPLAWLCLLLRCSRTMPANLAELFIPADKIERFMENGVWATC